MGWESELVRRPGLGSSDLRDHGLRTVQSREDHDAKRRRGQGWEARAQSTTWGAPHNMQMLLRARDRHGTREPVLLNGGV